MSLVRVRRTLAGIGAATLALTGLAVYGAARGRWVGGPPHAVVLLPPGVAELALADDGSRAVAVVVTFDRTQGLPNRAVVAVDSRAGRILWRVDLPAVSCCDFPVFSTTLDTRWAAVGGTGRVAVFRTDGRRVADFGLPAEGSLNSALQLWRGGQRLVAGQVEGSVTAFALPAASVVWRAHAGSALLALALNEGREEVLAVTTDGFVGLDGARGVVRYRLPVKGVRVADVVPAGRGFVVAWKGTDDVLAAGALESGSWRWQRRLGAVTVPIAQADRFGNWVGVSDFLGRGAWLLDRDGRVVWSARSAPSAVGVDPAGRVVVATGEVVEVRAFGARDQRWQARLPGRAHRLRLGGGTLAVLGSLDPQSALPDRLWLWRVSR